MSTHNILGKVAIVTGASAGIGESIAVTLASQGAKVVISGRDVDRLRAVQHKIVELGGEVTIYVGDTRHESTHKELVALAISTYGALHIAINNAGVYQFKSLLDIDGELIDNMIDINLKGLLFALKYQIPAIGRYSSAADWGHIINISTSGTKINTTAVDNGIFVYSVSKAGVDQATFLGAATGRAHHVKVNGIAPGPIYTPGTSAMDLNDFSDNHTLMKRAGDSDDISKAVSFLLTSGFIDGALLRVDGGMYIN